MIPLKFKSSYKSLFLGLDYAGGTGNAGEPNKIIEMICHGQKG
jgi:hypothetical protein